MNHRTLQENFGPPLLRKLLLLAALGYLLLILLNVTRSGWVYRWIPGPPRYFSQIAALFPSSKINDVEYRAEGWDCQEGLFLEIDTRPFFPIHADNKENRFSRAMHLFRHHNRVKSRLAAYVAARHNARIADNPSVAAEGEPGRVGGVRLVVGLTPIPPVSAGAKRYRRLPLSVFPWEQRRIWYEPSAKSLWNGCKEAS